METASKTYGKGLIELGTACGNHTVHVCRACYQRMLSGEVAGIKNEATGEEYCNVYRGESYRPDYSCAHPAHGK